MIAITGATGQLGQYVIESLMKTVPASQIVAIVRNPAKAQALYSAAIFLIPICISFDTAEKRRYATYLILNRRFSFEF